jgi:hypothetical protein
MSGAVALPLLLLGAFVSVMALWGVIAAVGGCHP